MAKVLLGFHLQWSAQSMREIAQSNLASLQKQATLRHIDVQHRQDMHNSRQMHRI
jgi:hypothetical protein